MASLHKEPPLVVDTTDFAAMELVDQGWIVEWLLPTGGIGLLFGKRNIGKTQLALTLAVAVANGERFLGTYTTKKGNVVYLSADMPLQLMQDRARRVLPGLHDGGSLHFVVSATPLDVFSAPVDGDWAEKVRDLEPKVVIVDTLRKTHRLPENDSDTPSSIYGAWKGLLGSKPALLFLHHDKKSQVGTNELDPDEAFRGSGAWLDDADAGLHLIRTSNSVSGASLVLHFAKLRGAPFQDPIPCFLNQESLLVERRGMSVRDVVAVLLTEAGNGKISRTQLVHEIMERTQCGRTRAYTVVDQELARLGLG